MAFNPNNYLVIGSDTSQGSGNYYIHERECNKDGTPGKIVTFADGKGAPKEVAQTYIEKGFDPKKIIINGQPSNDVFQKSTDAPAKQKQAEQLQNVGKAALLMFNPLAYIGLVATNPDFGLKMPQENNKA